MSPVCTICNQQSIMELCPLHKMYSIFRSRASGRRMPHAERSAVYTHTAYWYTQTVVYLSDHPRPASPLGQPRLISNTTKSKKQTTIQSAYYLTGDPNPPRPLQNCTSKTAPTERLQDNTLPGNYYLVSTTEHACSSTLEVPLWA